MQRIITISFFYISSLFSCTEVQIKALDGSCIHGRTVEFASPLDLSIIAIPRNYPMSGTTPLGKGLSYVSKYGCIGTIALNHPAILDGMNEKGLSVGAFYFPGYAEYTEVTTLNQNKALSPIEFTNWILTQFATIDEVKLALKNVIIGNTRVDGWGNTPPPFHYIVIDSKGKCLVIEPLSEGLVTYDNPLGVFTNSPTFDWHVTNLRNYINLTAIAPNSLTLNKIPITPLGQGSGLLGLPGDFTPPSRFVRAAFFSAFGETPKTAFDGVLELFHILNQFDIPRGAVKSMQGKVVESDYTMLTTVRDPTNLKYFYRTYEDNTTKMLDLSQIDFTVTTIKSLKLTSKQPIINMSKQLY